ARITAVDRRGTCLVFSLSHGEEARYIVGELGMTGRFLFKSAGERFSRHIHFTLCLDGGAEPEVHYWNPRRFGRIYLLDQRGLDRFIARRFGLDPLDVTKEEFVRLLRARRGAAQAAFDAPAGDCRHRQYLCERNLVSCRPSSVSTCQPAARACRRAIVPNDAGSAGRGYPVWGFQRAGFRCPGWNR